MKKKVAVAAALDELCGHQPVTAQAVEELVHAQQIASPVTEIGVAAVDLLSYDRLLSGQQELAHAI